MRIGGISYFVNGFYGGIYCGIETDSKIGAGNIFINGARQAYAWDVKFMAECFCRTKRTITTNNYQSVDP